MRLSVAEQFTEYGTLQEDGHKVENEFHQRLSSSISQVIGTIDASSKVSVQVAVPYINRRFKRLEGEEVERGTEAGIGDMTVLLRYHPLEYREGESLVSVRLHGGIKLPTGDSDRLKEELEEGHVHSHSRSTRGVSLRHGAEEEIISAVHGHDLALGSGSIDFPMGVSVFLEQGRIFLKGSTTYTIRTEGDHSYEYADSFMWDVGPAYYLFLQHESNVALRAALSGEHKGKDTGIGGEIQSDTGINAIFIGPEISFAVNDSWSGEIGSDFPIDIDNSGLQAVASYRLRGAVTYRF